MIAATSGDLDRLLGPGAEGEAAASAGDAVRVKVQGKWVYMLPDATVEQALDVAEGAVQVCLEEWLVNPAQYLVGQAAKLMGSPGLGAPVTRLMLQELCTRGRLDGIALLSRTLQPYLACHLPGDAEEVARQVDAMRDALFVEGRVGWRDLPNPGRPVSRKAWRMTVLAHGEWLGLGWRPEPGELVAW